jgi:hypothetical protein
MKTAADFKVGDRVETWTWMNNTGGYADCALNGGVVTKIGKKWVQVRWEHSTTAHWHRRPDLLSIRTWDLPCEETKDSN